MQKVCAWCGKPMGEIAGQGQEGVTHGICEECDAKVRDGTWQRGETMADDKVIELKRVPGRAEKEKEQKKEG